MKLENEKPSKNVKEQTQFERALVEYWWKETNRKREKQGRKSLADTKQYIPSENDKVLNDPQFRSKAMRYMKTQPWYKEKK